MLSTAYSAELEINRRLRRSVLVTAAAMAVAGVMAVLILDWAAWLKLLVLLSWLACVAWEVRRLRRGWASCTALRFSSDGLLSIRGPDGDWRPAQLEDDSILLRNHAWIRLRGPDGALFAEPLAGACRKSDDWRRLQVIWRHVGAWQRSC